MSKEMVTVADWRASHGPTRLFDADGNEWEDVVAFDVESGRIRYGIRRDGVPVLENGSWLTREITIPAPLELIETIDTIPDSV